MGGGVPATRAVHGVTARAQENVAMVDPDIADPSRDLSIMQD